MCPSSNGLLSKISILCPSFEKGKKEEEERKRIKNKERDIFEDHGDIVEHKFSRGVEREHNAKKISL